MNNNDIVLNFAREASAEFPEPDSLPMSADAILSFAAKIVRFARAAERESCAQLIESCADGDGQMLADMIRGQE